MAYDEQRTFATRPGLDNAMHVEHDGRRMYGRGQSIGFQYTNQPSFVPSVLASSSPTRGYAPTGPIHMAGPSRRPLPTPRTRPESMPPPPRNAPLVVQAPAPSRPAILATLTTSPTVQPARRPLPTPTPALTATRPANKHASVDLSSRPTSPVKSIVGAINANPDRDLSIPSSFSRRTAPLPDANKRHPLPPAASFSTPPPTWPRSPHSDAHSTQEFKSAPLWNRNLPVASSAQIGASGIERRSTVSGVPSPTVFPPAVPPPRSHLRRSESPERAQPAQRPQFSPSRRPLPSSPTEPPRVPSLHQRVLAPPEDENELPSPSDVSSLSGSDSYEPMTFADPLEEDEDKELEIVFARSAHSRSPQYGIRNLPTRSRIAIANRSDNQNANAIVSDTQQEQANRPPSAPPTTLAQTPAPKSSIPQAQPQTTALPQSTRPPVSTPFASFTNRSPLGSPTAEPQSLTLRFASMGLAEERERGRERETQQRVSSPARTQSPVRAAPDPTSPVRQQQGWPANVPPLPRTPGKSRPFFGTMDVSSKFVVLNIDIHDVSHAPCSPVSGEPAI